MEFEKIKELINLIQESNNISEFKFETEEAKINIRTANYSAGKEVIVQPSVVSGMQMPAANHGVMPAANMNMATPQPVQQTADSSAASNEDNASKEESSNYIEIKSPMVGTFYRSPSPEKGPFVKVGDTIELDETICLIEAMKLFNEVKAEVTGKIVKVMVEDASPVEYDQVLFLVEPV